MKKGLISVLSAALVATQGMIPAHAQIPDATLTLILTTDATQTPAGAPAALAPAPPTTHADSLAFQRVSRSVKARTSLWVLSTTGPFQVRGSEVSRSGIHRLGKPGEAGGAGLVRWSEVHQVQTRVSGSGEGAVIGAVTFGLLGLALGVALANADIGFNRSSDDSQVAGVVGFTLVSTAAGGFLGAVIGGATRKWKTIYSDTEF